MASLFLRLTSDIMKNSSPLNLKFLFFATVKTKITLLFCWTNSTLSSACKCDRVNQNKRNNQNFCEKVKFDKDLNWLGMSFSWYVSISKILLPVFYYMWLSLHEFWWHTWNIYNGTWCLPFYQKRKK